MKLATLTVLSILLGATGLVLATAPGIPHEEAKTPVPLVVYDTDGDKHTYFIKCSNGSRDLATCRGVSIWENVNPLEGLQTQPVFSGIWFEPDHRTLA